MTTHDQIAVGGSLGAEGLEEVHRTGSFSEELHGGDLEAMGNRQGGDRLLTPCRHRRPDPSDRRVDKMLYERPSLLVADLCERSLEVVAVKPAPVAGGPMTNEVKSQGETIVAVSK